MILKKENVFIVFIIIFGLYGILGRNDFFFYCYWNSSSGGITRSGVEFMVRV